jgi:hypothetical protein
MVAWRRFDNRMLQMKKQLRAVDDGFLLAFPLLYSIFPKEEFSERIQIAALVTVDVQTVGKK